jgi:endonuclease G
LRKSTFVLSYNNSRGTPNWVAWRTTRSDLGESIPRPDFAPDENLPIWFTKVYPADYSGSGYDRGHLVPSADRFSDPAANVETFLMTNIVPQTKDLNQFVWERLERYTRSIARRGSDVYVIAGCYGDQGRLRNKVTVPARCWKIIVVLPPGSNEIAANTRVIAVDIPNTGGIAGDNWRKYLTKVRLIEQRTGYDFLSAAPIDIQEQLETKMDETSRLDRDE